MARVRDTLAMFSETVMTPEMAAADMEWEEGRHSPVNTYGPHL